MLLQLDSWSVILNGSVEVLHPEGRAEILCMGNSFGVSPTLEKEFMKGVMKTKVDDCQVQTDRQTDSQTDSQTDRHCFGCRWVVSNPWFGLFWV